LQKALQNNRPHIHHSDQGWQYASQDYIALLQKASVTISMAEVGEPTQNGHAQRLIRTIKEEGCTYQIMRISGIVMKTSNAF